MTPLETLNEAVAKGGGLVKFAASLKISLQAVGAWRKAGYVPVPRAYQIAKMQGGDPLALMDPEMADMIRRG